MPSAYWRRDETGRVIFWIEEDGTEVFRCARWDVVTAFAGSRSSAWTVTEVDDRGLGLVPHDLSGLARTGRGLSDLFAPTAGHSVYLTSPSGQEALFDCVGDSGDAAIMAPHGVSIARGDGDDSG